MGGLLTSGRGQSDLSVAGLKLGNCEHCDASKLGDVLLGSRWIARLPEGGASDETIRVRIVDSR